MIRRGCRFSQGAWDDRRPRHCHQQARCGVHGTFTSAFRTEGREQPSGAEKRCRFKCHFTTPRPVSARRSAPGVARRVRSTDGSRHVRGGKCGSAGRPTQSAGSELCARAVNANENEKNVHRRPGSGRAEGIERTSLTPGRVAHLPGESFSSHDFVITDN